MQIIEVSKKSAFQNILRCEDDIHLFCQFFIDSKSERTKELQHTLRFNIENSHIKKIHLLNERIYSDEELGLDSSSDKIIQINLGRRLQFNDVFQYILEENIQGFHVIANSDIFLDNTIQSLRTSDIHMQKRMYALLRFDYNPDTKESKIFGPRMDSQDTWIFHSNFPITREQNKVFDFEFGKPGCDNKMIYLMKILGYNVINDPYGIKTHHYHASNVRNYESNKKETVPKPYAYSIPYNCFQTCLINDSNEIFQHMAKSTKNFTEITFEDDTMLYDYISCRKEKYIIPRIAGVENNYALVGFQMKENIVPQNTNEYIQQTIKTMKNNAGILLTSIESIIKYSDMYLKSFQNCQLYTGWEYHGDVFRGISQSHTFIQQNNPTKKILWAFALDIFHYIYTRPWTHALRGKRVLIISAFEDSIKEKIPIREKIYGIDLFPECEILTIKPPQTQGAENSREFSIEMADFAKRLDKIKDTYDVALVSCGGYGNLVCNYIYEAHGKSAIYVGGVLQMYFGILGSRWLRERADIVKLFENEYWTRPKDCEKPKNYKGVEGSCYW